MVFSSYSFLILFAVTFFIYYLPQMSRFQPTFLLVVSLIFYSQSEPKMIWLMFASAMCSGVISYRYYTGAKGPGWLRLGIILNLSLLFFFKYPVLIYQTIAPLLEGGHAFDFLKKLPLPVGISFYTFHNISLMVDAYYSRNKPRDPSVTFPGHMRDTMLYTDFFPQLIAGPIVKWNFFRPQIGAKSIKNIDWTYCARTLILGYFLKLFVADNLADTLIWFKYPYFLEKSSVTLAISLIAYSAQIFADFAGYSMLALGFAGLLGYQLPINFNAPFIATDPSDFWGRWHITLSQWLRQYLFNPLALRARRKGRMGISAFLSVMILGGLWHGASWNFVIWGLEHGFLLTAVYLYRLKIGRPVHPVIAIPLMFLCVSFSWVFFAIPEFYQSVAYIKALASNVRVPFDLGSYFYIALFSVPVVFLHVAAWFREQEIDLRSWLLRFEPVLHAAMLFLIVFNSGGKHGFVYFQF